MKINNHWLIILMLVLLFASAGYENAKASPDASATDKNTVLMQGYAFQPVEITIQKGETITWINQDSVRHTVTGSFFDSGLLGKGQSFIQVFNESGVFDYRCLPHPGMKGKIIVQ